jgi:hypothetical protein
MSVYMSGDCIYGKHPDPEHNRTGQLCNDNKWVNWSNDVPHTAVGNRLLRSVSEFNREEKLERQEMRGWEDETRVSGGINDVYSKLE